MVAWKAVSKQATAGSPGSAALTASMPASDLGWCSGARSVSCVQLAPDSGVQQDRPGELAAAVHHPVPHRVDGPGVQLRSQLARHLVPRRTGRHGAVSSVGRQPS